MHSLQESTATLVEDRDVAVGGKTIAVAVVESDTGKGSITDNNTDTSANLAYTIQKKARSG